MLQHDITQFTLNVKERIFREMIGDFYYALSDAELIKNL